MWSAQNLAEARPDILVMSSGKVFCVFWSDCTQPEVCPGGATHGQEEKRKLGVIDPRDTLEEHLLLPRLARQKLLHVLLLPNGNAQDLHPLLGNRKERITSPNNCFRFQRSRSPGHLLDPTGLDATSIPHLGLAMVHVDVSVCGQLFVHRRVHFIQTLWSTRGLNVIQERHHVFSGPHVLVDGFKGSVLSQSKQQWHEGVPLLPSFPL